MLGASEWGPPPGNAELCGVRKKAWTGGWYEIQAHMQGRPLMEGGGFRIRDARREL